MRPSKRYCEKFSSCEILNGNFFHGGGGGIIPPNGDFLRGKIG